MKFIIRIFRILIEKFIRKVEKKYVQLFKLNKSLCDKITGRTLRPKARLNQINNARTNNIVTTIWANTGTILGIIITLISFLLTMLLAMYIPLGNNDSHLFKVLFPISFLLLLYVIYYLLLYIIPYLINRIVFHLPPKEYADISLNSLDKSGMLTFVALKMWELCNDFENKVEVPIDLYNLAQSSDEHEFKSYYINNKGQLEKSISSFSDIVNRYSAKYNKELNNCIALMQLIARKLDIQERELCNHIFKFSPYIFRKRVDSLKSSALTLRNIINSHSYESDNSTFALNNNLREIIRIRNGVRDNSMQALEQVILYNEIHDCLIGMSSIVSTSRSLRIFCTGVSNALINRKENIKQSISSAKVDVGIEKMLSILHRSKAHYGMDLLVLLENFYKKKFTIDEPEYFLPEAIYSIKYPKRNKNPNLTGRFNGQSIEQIVNQCQNELCEMNYHMIDKYPAAIKRIKEKFHHHLSELSPVEGRIYFCLFGYSRIVRNVLKSFVKEIEHKNIFTFVTKEYTDEMIDTQIYRFELNDEKPNRNLRKTFTASDEFFMKLVNSNDKVIFIGGAEAYDKKFNKLLHTNNYQKRITSLINYVKREKEIDSEVWIIAGDYKTFDEFPDRSSLFGNEFFCDHYDKIDLYDFFPYRDNLKLISNIEQ